MKKVLVLGSVILAAGAATHAGIARAQEAGVASHAYVYTLDQSDAGPVPPAGALIVVQQPGTVRFVSCPLKAPGQVPSTPAEVTALLAGEYCASSTLIPPHNPTLDMQLRMVHQKLSDRYIEFVTFFTVLHGMPKYDVTGNAGVATTTYTFDRRHTDTIQLVFSDVNFYDGKNPELSTTRLTVFKRYDTEIRYPRITEKPIEQ